MNTDPPHGGDPDPATAALAALAAAHRSLSAVIDRELRAACGLSLAEADVLATLTRGPDGRQRMADIAGQMSVSKSGVTQIIARLPAPPVRAPIPRERIASRLPDADLGQLTQALRTIAGTSPPEASQHRGQTP